MNKIEITQMMKRALELAEISAKEGEIPVGAVICRNGEIVGEGRNRREKEKNALYHAEIEAIDNACKTVGGWRLWECEMFVTLEPCPMCAGATINSRLKKVTFGAYDTKNGSVGSVINLYDYPFNHKPLFEGGFMEEECGKILTDFFSELRKFVASKENKQRE